MRVGIDASNIRAGGGLTNLIEILSALQPTNLGIELITVWGSEETLKHLPPRSWLHLIREPLLEETYIKRLYWQHTKLSNFARQNCDVLLIPGGIYTGSFRPFVVMSQNLLPFEPSEKGRYGVSKDLVRLSVLYYLQRATFRKAAGIIFLTETAQKIVERRIGSLQGRASVISHGVLDVFRRQPKAEHQLDNYSWSNPFKLLYVSIVDVYKHQWHVVEAVSRLRREGVPVELNLIGPAYEPSLKRLRRVMQQLDPGGEFVQYVGPVPYDKLASHYHKADGFVFASSCETFGQILLEAMASGLPIACSGSSAMPEILGDAGVYFNPEKPDEIFTAVHSLIKNPALRRNCAKSAHERAQAFSWQKCAHETFSFLVNVVKRDQKCVAS